MPHEQRENSGIAFRNDRKREGKADADWTGSIQVGGRLYWLNIWEKAGQRGPFLTVSVREKTAGAAPAAPAAKPSVTPEATFDGFDSSVPF